jgi:hypothetical protein
VSERRLTSLSDLPTTYAERRAKFQEERDAAKRRNAQASREARQRRTSAATTVTWIEPVPLVPFSRTRVVGVASDAADSVKALYGVKG